VKEGILKAKKQLTILQKFGNGGEQGGGLVCA